MPYMVVLFSMILFSSLSSADEIGLVVKDSAVVKDPTVEELIVNEEKETPLLKQIDEYMQQENERIKSIKLLSLDLEKSTLQLKQREVQVKLAALDNRVSFSPESDSVGRPTNSSKRLLGVAITNNFKEAILEMNGKSMIIHEQDTVGEGKVSLIAAEGVSIENPDGTQEKLSLNL